MRVRNLYGYAVGVHFGLSGGDKKKCSEARQAPQENADAQRSSFILDDTGRGARVIAQL